MASRLKKMGFRNLQQVEKCIHGYDDDRLSRIASGSRQGQTTRFEYMLLAGMGENYIRRLAFAGEWYRNVLKLFESQRVEIHQYDPAVDVPDAGNGAPAEAGEAASVAADDMSY